MGNIHDKCGIFAVSSPKEVNIQLLVEGIRLLQHRGQESAGIAYAENGEILTIKGLGLVDEVFKENLNKFIKNGIGHVRYSTSGKSSIEEAQPLGDSSVVVTFNGTISNYYQFGSFKVDTEFIYRFFKQKLTFHSIPDTVKEFMKVVDGGYSVAILLNDEEIVIFRDPRGFHPVVLGFLEGSLVVSSEDSVIRQLGGSVLKHILPGEVITMKNGKILYDKVIYEEEKNYATCSFEYIYFARPDSNIDGHSVYSARIRLGELLAEKHPANGDIVVPVPDSSRPIALGFSRKSRIPLEEPLVRTISSVRSFIMPSQDKRNEVLEEKFGVVVDAVRDKRIVLIDDSIVRGNTMKRIISMLRNAGAKEIHVRIGSPMIKYPCYMGIDFPKREELIAHNKSEREIGNELNADSIEFLSVEEMVQAIGRRDLCNACFSGVYPLKFKYNSTELERVFGK
ncbi:amidophosphoribosyltransferase [Saccharolobus islandicus]|jgi:amidophosphoribosyltransferase|uniref:amidophosphoribosyltransferase n=1 Tax=Saccharolobus islandicus TaxID=43080 RepID=UPI00241E91F6|nr:amidophosphoribosyltransferase [Sulfolobus islandicus]